MKKIALTVAVLGLGLAACQDNAPDNAASTENTIETEAAADTNAALNTTGSDVVNSADNALDAAGNTVANGADAAGNALENAGDAAANSTNAQ